MQNKLVERRILLRFI